VQGGIAQSASGAAKLAAGSAALRSGASSLASGLGGLASGAQASASGADGLATGATELATGLKDGASQVPEIDVDTQAATAEVAADPVSVTVTRDNGIADAGQAVAAFIVPLGLWIGALAVFLIMRPIPARMLASTARTGRLLGSTLGRASLITSAQALLLVALLHLGVGVDWALLPATAGFALLTATAFTAFHHLLVAWLGRAGLVVSLLAMAIQITTTGGLYPIELLAEPYQLVSPLLPLTYAVTGMQSILAGGALAPVLGSVVALLGFGVASVLLAGVAVRRTRRASTLWPLPAT
jgi:putative membrane protein